MPFDGIVTKAVIEEINEKIIPGKITKIYQPTKTELLITVRAFGRNSTILFSIHPTYARLHLTSEMHQNPPEPPMFCMVLRKHLSGAIIESVEQYGMERIVTFSIKSRNEIGDITTRKLVVELMGKHSNVMLIDEDRGIIIDSLKHVSMAQNRHRTILPGAEYVLPPQQDKKNPIEIDGDDFIRKIDFNSGNLDKQIVQTLTGISPFLAKDLVYRARLGSPEVYLDKFIELQKMIKDQLYEPAIYTNGKEDFHVLPIASTKGNVSPFPSTNEMVDHFYSGKAERDRVKQQAKDLYRFIKNEQDKNKRKLKKHLQTIKKAENADHYKKLGELLTANMHTVRKGDTSASVIDYYDPNQAELVIDLNPNLTPSENAQRFFKTYQKLKTSKQVVEKEIIKTKEEINYFDQLLQQVNDASMDDVEEIREELIEQGYIKKQVNKGKKKNKVSKPKPEEYESSTGIKILVGKNNKQNDYLTTKIAHRDDLWLHTKDIPGSHVVIRAVDPDEDTILEAAQIAAYFSKSKESSSVPVDYTKIRHVKKPNGAKPGFVTYDNQKTLFVTPDKEIITQLIKREL